MTAATSCVSTMRASTPPRRACAGLCVEVAVPEVARQSALRQVLRLDCIEVVGRHLRRGRRVDLVELRGIAREYLRLHRAIGRAQRAVAVLLLHVLGNL